MKYSTLSFFVFTIPNKDKLIFFLQNSHSLYALKCQLNVDIMKMTFLKRKFTNNLFYLISDLAPLPIQKNVKSMAGSHNKRRPTMMKATILYMKSKEAKKVYVEKCHKRQRGRERDDNFTHFSFVKLYVLLWRAQKRKATVQCRSDMHSQPITARPSTVIAKIFHWYSTCIQVGLLYALSIRNVNTL